MQREPSRWSGKLAENVAAITFNFMQHKWPPGDDSENPDSLFRGFPGFRVFCAEAGYAFAKHERCDEEWIDALEEYCEKITDGVARANRPLSRGVMERIAVVAIATMRAREIIG